MSNRSIVDIETLVYNIHPFLSSALISIILTMSSSLASEFAEILTITALSTLSFQVSLELSCVKKQLDYHLVFILIPHDKDVSLYLSFKSTSALPLSNNNLATAFGLFFRCSRE
jgi:hypothetical protein